MKKNIPTYHLDDDFRARLNVFTQQVLSEGFEFFSREFSRIDDYVKQAQENDHGESMRTMDKATYLLELLAFSIQDKRDREAFNKAPKTLIVMPDCLSLHNMKCEKVDTPYGDVCKRCVQTCQAFGITELAAKYRCKVIFSKRKLTEQLEHYRETMGDYGVIGVACIKMLATGMRTAAEVGIPARGVLLNFSGCEHWNDEPCASEFSMTWLEVILKEKYGPRSEKTDG
jgi:hypothetical protein